MFAAELADAASRYPDVGREGPVANTHDRRRDGNRGFMPGADIVARRLILPAGMDHHALVGADRQHGEVEAEHAHDGKPERDTGQRAAIEWRRPRRGIM